MTNEEMDRLCAEKVMGVNLEPYDDYEYRTTEGQRKCWDGEPNLEADGWECTGWDRLEYTEERYWRRPIKRAATIPCYTRNIAQAWELLEKCFDETTTLTIRVSRFYDKKYQDLRGWCLLVDSLGYELYEKTAPLAIVKAVLKAKNLIND